MAFDGLDHLHLTGITLGISEAACATAFALLEAARSHGLTVSFDPNLRLNLWPDQDKMRGLINTVASQATIVLPGLGEGALLTGRREPEAIADFYLSAGANEVVVKLGRDGAKAWDRHGAATSIPYFVEPVDTVGAGDGFAAGYLDAALGGLDLQGRVDHAAAVGAIVTTRRGDLAAIRGSTWQPPGNGSGRAQSQ